MVHTHMGPISNIGNNLRNITTYLCKSHDFNATIGNVLIYLKLKAKTYDLRIL
jgi:hypothetical protein